MWRSRFRLRSPIPGKSKLPPDLSRLVPSPCSPGFQSPLHLHDSAVTRGQAIRWPDGVSRIETRLRGIGEAAQAVMLQSFLAGNAAYPSQGYVVDWGNSFGPLSELPSRESPQGRRGDALFGWRFPVQSSAARLGAGGEVPLDRRGDLPDGARGRHARPLSGGGRKGVLRGLARGAGGPGRDAAHGAQEPPGSGAQGGLGPL